MTTLPTRCLFPAHNTKPAKRLPPNSPTDLFLFFGICPQEFLRLANIRLRLRHHSRPVLGIRIALHNLLASQGTDRLAAKEVIMTVAQWMTKTVLTIKPQDTLKKARELMIKHRINQLPVVVDDRVVGIVTDRDVRDAYPSSMRLLRGKDVDEFADSHIVEEVMTFNVATIGPQMSIREAAQHLRKQRFGALPIVEQGKLVGVITRSDLLDAALAGEFPGHTETGSEASQ